MTVVSSSLPVARPSNKRIAIAALSGILLASVAWYAFRTLKNYNIARQATDTKAMLLFMFSKARPGTPVTTKDMAELRALCGRVSITQRDDLMSGAFAVSLSNLSARPQTIPFLLECSRAPEHEVRQSAASLLGDFSNDMPPAKTRLQEMAQSDPDAAVRREAANSLAAFAPHK